MNWGDFFWAILELWEWISSDHHNFMLIFSTCFITFSTRWLHRLPDRLKPGFQRVKSPRSSMENSNEKKKKAKTTHIIPSLWSCPPSPLFTPPSIKFTYHQLSAILSLWKIWLHFMLFKNYSLNNFSFACIYFQHSFLEFLIFSTFPLIWIELQQIWRQIAHPDLVLQVKISNFLVFLIACWQLNTTL